MIQTKTLSDINKSCADIKVNVVIVCAGANTKFDFKSVILGVKVYEFVGMAFNGYDITYADKYEDYVALARQLGGGYNYTVVIGGNLPLITQSDVSELVQYCVFKNANFVKFVGGIVVNNEYLKNEDKPQVDNVFTGNVENFYLVENKRQLRQAAQILQDRIIDKHERNGVEISGKVVIEPFVEIDSGVVVKSGNVLKGNTHIASGVILNENNVIENTFVDDGSCISNSVLINSKIGKNCYIMPFCNITNVAIKDNTTLKSNTSLNTEDK